jgi:hypothetical protein
MDAAEASQGAWNALVRIRPGVAVAGRAGFASHWHGGFAGCDGAWLW